MTPADRFCAIGEALYGQEWRRKIGRALDVNERQIRRWADGEYEPPPGVWEDLAALCQNQSKTLARLAKEIKAEVKGKIRA